MKIRRYLGSTSHEAMLKLKRELGQDAIILHTRKIRRPGLFGFFKRPLIEVVAAMDEGETVSRKEENSSVEKAVFKGKRELFIKDEENAEDINFEVKKIRSLVENAILKSETKYDDSITDDLVKIEKTLLKNGVSKEVIRAVFKQVNNQTDMIDTNYSMLFQHVKKSIINFIGKPVPINVNNAQKVIFFIGPTGVGKTTTLAKLAANFTLEYKRSVGLITADTYRIAAVEQLKTYSEILGIPLKIIYEAKDINKALSNYMDKELILVDTAGRSHKNHEQIKEIQYLIDSVSNKEVYLVLSAATDWETTNNILRHYDFVEDLKIIFTKLDESDNPGVILNTRYYTNKPLSYFTNGQNVPDDIEIADSNELIKYLIGES